MFKILETKPKLSQWSNLKSAMNHFEISDGLASWLTEKNLLTSKLKKNVSNFRFQVLNEHIDSSVEDAHRAFFTREIIMFSGNRPYILGQTKATNLAIQEHPWISRLGENTLGEALRDIQEVTRSKFTYNCFDIKKTELKNMEVSTHHNNKPLIWARRSIFTLGESNLSTVELFLPGIEDLVN